MNLALLSQKSRIYQARNSNEEGKYEGSFLAKSRKSKSFKPHRQSEAAQD